MLQIGKTIISTDLINEDFCCNLDLCKGACCVEGDSGAPISTGEAEKIKKLYPYFESFLSAYNKTEIKKQGFSVIDSEGELVTPIVGNNECVYTFVDEKGITKCAIEKAWYEKHTDFRKPLSCHLFPIRITRYKRFDAVNYQQLDICKNGRECGKNNKIPLWQYLKEPLILKYGEQWYKDLTYAAENLPERLRS
jgi:hypothetical protein